ncbi:hypothetical protein BD324DRAFT_584223 [Kockovaella imperatae]|uniref:C-type lectin protein n=1 Tax=Kockovaella imperatae TaxID=4999 RepID=A0A1Y1U909_9TREE|nr:hypothetical protein BD324DRAFT_584223 [Kockovaella imperatae]ORX33987.1 hypothetical protein BD324DRAFT_584223 [Kockovaella imperatae]
MSGINIYTLPSLGQAAPEDASSSLKQEIEAGLIGKTEATIPGDTPEDKSWAYTRSVPTVVLYDEMGLRLYDDITAHAKEYYLFDDELELLKTHGRAIARCMGFPRVPKDEHDRRHDHGPLKRWKPARWGDTEVGKWNEGVNGEEGLAGGPETGWDIVELGAGALRKTGHLLTALASTVPDGGESITYHPLDLSYRELERVLGEMNESFGSQLQGKVNCIGLHGDYEAGLQFIRDGKLPSLRQDLALSELTITDESASGGTWSPMESEDPLPSSPPTRSTESNRPRHFVFLGSSIGNFSRQSAGPFLASLPLRRGDTLLLGLDGRPTPGADGRRKLEHAYNDPAGYTKAFEEHGWQVVRRELGLKGDAGVEFVGRYNEIEGRHESYLKSRGDQTLHLPLSNRDVELAKDELLHIEWSYKYSQAEAIDLFKSANLRVVESWKAPESEYRLFVLERPHVTFNDTEMKSEPKKIKGVPTWDQWEGLWKLWDHITLDMIPPEMLHTKPIDLRHICLFYLGHIPTFLDIHLTNMTHGSHTEPVFFKDIFERGIDPDVDDPTKIHSHSEVPVDKEDWPTLQEILAFRDRVRDRLHGVYDQISSGQLEISRHVARVLFMTYEHEAQHAETLLYMLIQSPTTLPPTAVSTPEWDQLAAKWQAQAVPNKKLTIPAGTIQLGHDDIEKDDSSYPHAADWEGHELGWDIENPSVNHQVATFAVDALPISNSDYLSFLTSKTDQTWNAASLPASWVKVDDSWQVRTLYGPVSFHVAGSWPLMASKNEIEDFAKWKGGRLPTEPELRLLWEHEEGPRPAGVLANVGFEHWHPIPPAMTSTDNAGKVLHGHNGGVWEWTSTQLSGHEGFQPSDLYPGYSADFFDGKHFVVLGGSFATVPCIAARKSFRNWYQANYRFSFIGGRVAYDVKGQ